VADHTVTAVDTYDLDAGNDLTAVSFAMETSRVDKHREAIIGIMNKGYARFPLRPCQVDSEDGIENVSKENEKKATNGNEEDATNGIEEDAINGIDEEATNGNEEEATNGNEEEATNGIEEDAINGIEEEATNGNEEEATNGNEEDAINGIEEEVLPLDAGTMTSTQFISKLEHTAKQLCGRNKAISRRNVEIDQQGIELKRTIKRKYDQLQARAKEVVVKQQRISAIQALLDTI